MKSDAVLIARAQERAALYDAVARVLTNPAVIAVAGVLVVEYLQAHDEGGRRVAGGGWMGSTAGTALETALAAQMVLQGTDKIAEGIAPIAKALGPLLMAGGV